MSHVYIYISLYIPSLQVITEHQVGFTVLYSSFQLAIQLTHDSVYLPKLLIYLYISKIVWAFVYMCVCDNYIMLTIIFHIFPNRLAAKLQDNQIETSYIFLSNNSIFNQQPRRLKMVLHQIMNHVQDLQNYWNVQRSSYFLT